MTFVIATLDGSRLNSFVKHIFKILMRKPNDLIFEELNVDCLEILNRITLIPCCIKINI